LCLRQILVVGRRIAVSLSGWLHVLINIRVSRMHERLSHLFTHYVDDIVR